MAETDVTSTAAPKTKVSRRLRPEAVAALAARTREVQLEEFYQKDVQDLEPEELAIMKAAFFAAERRSRQTP